jgi:hypothetical protein
MILGELPVIRKLFLLLLLVLKWSSLDGYHPGIAFLPSGVVLKNLNPGFEEWGFLNQKDVSSNPPLAASNLFITVSTHFRKQMPGWQICVSLFFAEN